MIPISRVRCIPAPPLSLRGGASSSSDGEGEEGNGQNQVPLYAETPRAPHNALDAIHPGSRGTSTMNSAARRLHPSTGDDQMLEEVVDGALNEADRAEGPPGDATDDDRVVSEDFGRFAIPSDRATFAGESPPMETDSPFVFKMNFPRKFLGFKIELTSHSSHRFRISEVNEGGPVQRNVFEDDSITDVNGTRITDIIAESSQNPTADLIRHIQGLSEDDELEISFCRNPDGYDHSIPPGRSGSEPDRPQRTTTGQGFNVDENYNANKEDEFFVGRSVKVQVGMDSIEATVTRCLPEDKFVVQFVDFNQRDDMQVDRTQLTAIEPLPLPDEDESWPNSGRRMRRSANRAMRIIRHQESGGTANSVVQFYNHWTHRSQEKVDRQLVRQRTVILDHHDPDHRWARIERLEDPLNIEKIIRSFQGGDEVVQKLKHHHNLLWLKDDEAARRTGFDDDLVASNFNTTAIIHGMKYGQIRDNLAVCSRRNLSSYPCSGRIRFRDGMAKITVSHCDTCRVNTLVRLSVDDRDLGLTTEMIDAVIVKLLECKEFGVIADQRRVSPLCESPLFI